jgi:hypothetical protein
MAKGREKARDSTNSIKLAEERIAGLNAVLQRECRSSLLDFGKRAFDYIDTLRARREMMWCNVVPDFMRYGTLSHTTLRLWVTACLAEEALHYVWHNTKGQDDPHELNYCRVSLARLMEEYGLVVRDEYGVLQVAGAGTMDTLRKEVWGTQMPTSKGTEFTLCEVLAAGRQEVFMGPDGLPPTFMRPACEQGVWALAQTLQLTIERGEGAGAALLDQKCAAAATATFEIIPPYMKKILQSEQPTWVAMSDLNRRFMGRHALWREELKASKVREMEVIIYPPEVGVAGGGGNGSWIELRDSIHVVDVDQLQDLQKKCRGGWAALLETDLYFLYNESLCMAFGCRDAMALEWITSKYVWCLIFPGVEKNNDGGHNTLFCACNYAFRYKVTGSNAWIYVDKNEV